MNNKKQSKWVIAILTALTVVFVAGCNDSKPVETPKTPEKQVTTQENKQPAAENNTDEVANDGHENEAELKTFISKDGGFSLTQPEMWNDNVSAVESKNEQGEPEASFYLTVNGKADEQAGSLMTITKMTKESYEVASKEEGPGMSNSEKLGENDKFVWVMTTNQTNPYEEKSDEFKKFNDMKLEFDFVQKNFKINN